MKRQGQHNSLAEALGRLYKRNPQDKREYLFRSGKNLTEAAAEVEDRLGGHGFDQSILSKMLAGDINRVNDKKLDVLCDVAGASEEDRRKCHEALERVREEKRERKLNAGLPSSDDSTSSKSSGFYENMVQHVRQMRKSGKYPQADVAAGYLLDFLETELTNTPSSEARKPILRAFGRLTYQQGIAKSGYLTMPAHKTALEVIAKHLGDVANEAREYGEHTDLYQELRGLEQYRRGETAYLFAVSSTRSLLDWFSSAISWHQASIANMSRIGTVESLGIQTQSVRQILISEGALGNLDKLQATVDQARPLMKREGMTVDRCFVLHNGITRGYILAQLPEALARLEEEKKKLQENGEELDALRPIQYLMNRLKWFQHFDQSRREEFECDRNEALALSNKHGLFRYISYLSALRIDDLYQDRSAS